MWNLAVNWIPALPHVWSCCLHGWRSLPFSHPCGTAVPALTWEGERCVLVGGRQKCPQQGAPLLACAQPKLCLGQPQPGCVGRTALCLCWTIPKHIFCWAEHWHHCNWQAGKITASSGKREAPVSVPSSPLLAAALHISSSQAAAPESRGGR